MAKSAKMLSGKGARCLFVVAICAAGTMMSAACSQKPPKNRVLTFLFPPAKTAVAVKKPVKKPEAKVAVSSKKKRAPERVNDVLYSHKPYIEGKCGKCHKGANDFITSIFGNHWDGIFRKGGGMPGPLVLPAKKLCVKCHKDLSAAWAEKRGLYLHRTAADGKCLKCHNAHQSRYPFVLKDAPDRLCISCHNKDTKIGAPECMKDGHTKRQTDCMSCHNPHLGKTKAMLKKNYKEGKHTVAEKKGKSGGNATPGK